MSVNTDQVKEQTKEVPGKSTETVGKTDGNKMPEVKGDPQKTAGVTQASTGDAKKDIASK